MKWILITLLTFNAYANDFTPINKGETSKIDGYVISIETEKKVRNHTDTLEYKNNKLEQLRDLQLQKINILQERLDFSQKYITMYERKENFQTLINVGCFTFGVALTGLLSYGVIKTLK